MRPYVVHPGAGFAAPLARLGTLHKISSAITAGRLAAIEHRLLPRQLGLPLHRHWREHELSIVLAGTLGALLNEHQVLADAGAYLWKPRGQWHTFWNAGETELRFIDVLIPGGLEGYFRILSQLLAADGSPEPAAIDKLAEEYGIEFDFQQTDRICSQFGLSFGCAARPWSLGSERDRDQSVASRLAEEEEYPPPCPPGGLER
jgi:mannose-6-phosphate isomerase-like protein (cupin superfamily)